MKDAIIEPFGSLNRTVCPITTISQLKAHVQVPPFRRVYSSEFP